MITDGVFDMIMRAERGVVIPVYVLVGYWPGETHEDRDYRRRRLREFGADPYPMPFVRSRELVGFQRWVIGAYDRKISWEDWVRADYEPRRLGHRAACDVPEAGVKRQGTLFEG